MDDIIQGTEEWHALRLGKVTASRISDVMAKIKSGVSASRTNYMSELIIERVTGKREEGYKSPAMEWGNETEAQARDAYIFYTRNQVKQVAFISHPTIADAGASPDGLVNDDGLIEIKCPNSATHLNTILNKKIKRQYLLQMQWQMCCTGRKWCDFVSYDPRFPEEMATYIQRVNRDDELIAEITNEVEMFLSELNAKCEELKEQYL